MTEQNATNETQASENPDEVVEGVLLEKPGGNFHIDKEAVQEAEEALNRVVTTVRRKFWESAIIRTGVVIVALKVVTITGNIIAEKMREKKSDDSK